MARKKVAQEPCCFCEKQPCECYTPDERRAYKRLPVLVDESKDTS